MELTWDDSPAPCGPFFTRDLYEKYSFAPHIRELWASVQSPDKNSNLKERDAEAEEASRSSSIKDAEELKDKSCITSQEHLWDSMSSDASSADKSANATANLKSEKKKKQIKVEIPYPEPRLPFPCMSSLSFKDQKTYLGFLKSKKAGRAPQWLRTRVNNELLEFSKYLHEVAKICADDYNFIPEGAFQYTEEFFTACAESIRTFPQFYQIHEMTSLTGGTFNSGLTLTFEKQLLTMGSVDITDHKIVAAGEQLSSDYQSVSSACPPAKKAKDMHARISTDTNAEKLCAWYGPQVCLTRDALLRLLDNHGPDFGDQWELPVTVKAFTTKVNNQKKVVYIDSPILKTEIPTRERSLLYHEESLKLSVTKNGIRNVFHLQTEQPVAEQQPLAILSGRICVPTENTGLDFEMDLSDLETFGESATAKRNMRKETPMEQETVKSDMASCPGLQSETLRSMDSFPSSACSPKVNKKRSVSNLKEAVKEPSEPAVKEGPNIKVKLDSASDADDDYAFDGDSDDEKLVIDDPLPAAVANAKPLEPKLAAFSLEVAASETDPAPTESLSSCKGARTRRQTKKVEVCGDQLTEIMRMQSAMFKSADDPGKAKSSTRCKEPTASPRLTSLVKPCVTSYLERQKSEDTELSTTSHELPVINMGAPEHKKILSENLQACAENEQDYQAPEEGNVFYKLYSLQDVLLLVSSSVSLTHTRPCGNGRNEFVPVHVLPKMEYQLCYGVECLTSSEACQLWTESLLHSRTVPYIAHINAHTSTVALVRKLPDDWIHNISCGFKPSKSLNILHHLLKKLTGLEEGQYLAAHKAGEPFVTLMKAAKGGSLNLHQVHSSPPHPPPFGPVPWIPVDPAVVLPFHHKHGRAPCTFPPNQSEREESNHYRGPKYNQGAQSHKKTGKPNKRKLKRKQFMKKLIDKSI